MKAQINKLIWNPCPNKEWEAKLEKLFNRWKGTPYKEGSQALQSGVDCVRFSAAILDSMEKVIRPRVWIPADVSFHNGKEAWKAAKALMEKYWPIVTIKDGNVEPGDMLISGPINGGPGHSALVGVEPGTIWHITNTNNTVSFTGFSGILPTGFKLYRVMRIKNRDLRW